MVDDKRKADFLKKLRALEQPETSNKYIIKLRERMDKRERERKFLEQLKNNKVG